MLWACLEQAPCWRRECYVLIDGASMLVRDGDSIQGVACCHLRTSKGLRRFRPCMHACLAWQQHVLSWCV